MRWFVEVSRVGENSSDEKYCVEAKQWQAALQEARKLRGDSGPLSKFSIELLDDGYRAVDPKQKLRYVVAKAPQDAELSDQASTPHRNGQQTSLRGSAPSAAPPPVAPSAAPAAVASVAPAAPAWVAAPVAGGLKEVAPVAPVTSSAAPSAPVAPVVPAPVSAVPVAAMEMSRPPSPLSVAAHAEPYAGVPSSALSPNAPASAVHLSAASAQPGAPAAAKSPSAFPPRPASALRAPSASPGPDIAVQVDAIPPAPAVPQGLGPAVPSQNLTQPSPAIDFPPPSSVLRSRQEEPTPESPITYREIAYVVEPGVSRGSVEALLWASFRDVSRELSERPGQKFVQLAVFDHRFDKRPERAPLGTLAWKDWRGNPVLSFPFFDGTPHVRPSGAPPSLSPPSIVPVAVVQVGGSKAQSAPPPAPEPAPVSAAAQAPAVAPLAVPTPVAATAAVPAPTPTQSAAPSPSAAPPVVTAPPSTPAAAPAPALVAVAPVSATSPDAAVAEPAAIPLTREKAPSHPPSGREKLPSQPGRASRPRLPAVRRRAGEDLIGELFETMHDLHFMSGIADGAEFVLAALDSVVPCDAVLIHVFDINSRQFVVVRAKGPGSMQVLLHRTPDSEPFFHAVMRRHGSVAIHDTHKDGRVLGQRWEVLGVQPTRALCGPVRQGGRYLGLVEVVNPMGDAPFHQTEQNAIDYVCQQFAEFLANRPIVLDADVILRR